MVIKAHLDEERCMTKDQSKLKHNDLISTDNSKGRPTPVTELNETELDKVTGGGKIEFTYTPQNADGTKSK